MATLRTTKAWVPALLQVSVLLAMTGTALAQTYYFNRNAQLTGDRDFTRAHNWTQNANGTGSYPTSTTDDDFTSNSIGSAWTLRDIDNWASTVVNTTTNDNQLTMQVRGADAWGATNEFAVLYRKDITNNFDVSVKVVSQSGGSAWAKGGIMVGCDLNDLTCGGYLILAVTPSNSVALQWVVDVTPDVTQLDGSSTAGNSTLPKWLRLVKSGYTYTGWYKSAEGDAWSQVGATTSPIWAEPDSHVGIFANSNNASGTATWVFDDWKGGTAISGTGYTLSLAGSSGNGDANAVVSSDVTAASIDFSSYSGTLSFGGENGLFATYYDNEDFTGTSFSRVDSVVNFDWGAGSPDGTIGGDSWSAAWEGYVVAPVTGTYTFYTHDDDRARLYVNGVQIVEDWISSVTTEKTSSTVALTAGVPLPIKYWFVENSGNASARLRWQCSGCSPAVSKEIIPKRHLMAGHMAFTGAVNMGSSGTFTAADGALEFTGSSGTQVFTPRSGQTMPRILHSGAGTLQLATNTLTTIGFAQSAGILDLNGRNITTVAGGYNRGDFNIWNGTTTSLTNLGGRTLTVAGNASFVGTSYSNRVNLDPGSSWTLAVTGQLNARNAVIANSNASVTAGTAYRSGAGSGNSNWTVNAPSWYWGRNFVLTGQSEFSRTSNWASNADGTGIRPFSAADDWFDDLSLGSAWTFKDRDGEETVGSYRVTGGQLILTGDGGDIWGATNEYTLVRRSDITGDFDTQVKLVSVTTTGGTGYKIGMMMADDFDNLGSGGYAKLNFHGTGKFEFSRDQSTTVGEIESNSDGGTGLSLPIWMRLIKSGTSVSAYYKTTEGGSWVQVGTAQTPQSTAANSQIGLFVCAGSGVATALFDHFQGGTNLATSDDNLSFNGSGANADANATLNLNQAATSIDFTNYSGTFNFGTYTLSIRGGAATFTSTMGLTPGTGILDFQAAWGVNSSFTPKSGATFPAITKSDANSMDLTTNSLITPSITLTGGSIYWGSGLTHQIGALTTSGGSAMTFLNSTVQITSGNADLSGIPITAGTGTLQFTGTSGTQVFTPRSGATHPNITHTGAGTLQLATNDLSALSFSQSAGTLDLNGENITTTSSGNFTLTNGTGSSFTNLGGRTLTVAGNASFTGQSGNLANLNPTTGWTVAATGTLTASYAVIANSNASVTGGIATNSVNGSGNTNWNLDAVDYSAWSYNGRIQFNTTPVGAAVTGNVSNFPLLLRFTGSNFNFNQAKSDGADLRFQDPDGTPLYHQIERWDAVNKLGDVWVLVPQVDGNSDKDYVRMHWGNASATTVSNGTAVFGTAAGYIGVWHLHGGSLSDATANANTLGNNGTSTDTGLVAEGRYIDGSNLNISNNATLNPTAALTLQAWVKPKTWEGGNHRIIQKNSSDNQYRLLDEGDLLKLHLTGLSTTEVTSALPTPGQWSLVTGTYDGSSMKLYVNGTLTATQAATGSIATTSGGIDLGGKPGSAAWGDRLSGWLDEMVLANVAHSADRIKLSYETQKPRVTCLTFPDGDLSQWSYRTRININTTASGANITTDQANYPLLVRLTAANFNFSQANSNGSDIRFSDSTGAHLAYEVERWDAASSAAEIWVLIPTVKGNNHSQWFNMHWGRPTAVSMSSGASVFSATSGYGGVYHLNEDGSTTAGAYKDATGFRNVGTGVNLTNASDVSALVGTGHTFANLSNQGITVPHHYSQRNNSAITVQAWINSTSQLQYKRIVGKPFTSAISPLNEFDLELDVTGTKIAFSLTLAGTEAGYVGTTTMSNGTWYMVAGTYDGAAQKVFTNGALEYSGARSGSVSDYAQPLTIGKYYHDNGSNWDGMMDEVRISTVARSTDWLKLDYETMKSGSTVVTVGNSSPVYAKSAQLFFNTTSSGGGANVAGNVSNIPMLIRFSSSNFDWSAVRDDGSDIRFIDKGGSALYHEVVEWDKGNKTGKVWVKVPQVDGNSSTDFITAYYGCATCTGNPWAVPAQVWSGYTSVYHLAAPETRAVDAATLGNHGNYVTNMAQMDGVVTQNAVLFDGGSANSRIDIPNESNYDFTTNISVSAWIKVSSWLSDWAPVINHGDDVWRLHRNGNGNGMGFAVDKTAAPYDASSATNVNDGAWHHVVGVYDGANVRIYVDGVVGATAPALTGSADVDNNAVSIAYNSTQTSRRWNGGISEVRLSNNSAVLSADFIKLSYENQKLSATMITTPATTSAFVSNKVFRFNTTASGANVAGDVHDFPLLIRLTDATLIDAVQGGAPDIRFLDGDGVTWLSYQVERWDSTNNLAEVWVRVPKIDGNSAGDHITLYYNDVTNGSVPNGSCGTCVFATAAGFTGVWHLNEDGNIAAGGYDDATANAYDGQGVNIDDTDDIAGQIGIGQNLDGTNEYIDMTGTWPTGTARRSLSIWAKSDNATIASHDIIAAYGAQVAGQMFGSYFNDATDTWQFFGWGASDINTAVAASTVFRHHFITYDSDSVLYYLDGARIAAAQRTLATTQTTLKLGARPSDNTNTWDGMLDEARLANVVRDTNWIKLEYQTQRSDLTPLFNPSQNAFLASRKYTFNTTKTGANIMADVENFPLLVRITGSTIVDEVQDDWDDIRFLDGDGKTWLNYQVERWSKAADSAEVWVLVPKVDGNSDRDFITLYYSDSINAAVDSGECASCVFDTTQNYASTWHLNNSLSDATVNANNGTNQSSTNGDGVIGSGRSFSGSAQYATFGNGNSLKNIANYITVEAWVRTSQGASAQDNIIRHDGHYTALQTSGTAPNGWTAIWNTGLQLKSFTWDGNFDDNTWHYYVSQYSRASGIKWWKDGAVLSSSSSDTGVLATNGTANFSLGCSESGGGCWPGNLDEVRVSNSYRDSNYIKLNYQTQRRSGNVFWNSRPGPNNKAVLTALPGEGSIALSWNSALTDSANADSIGIWVKYTGTLDSVGATGQTKVAVLPKTDSSYSYPATYPGTYVFGLAVRNSNVKWSPFTAASIDTVMQIGDDGMRDTVYVDSAIGSDANSCAQAANPATPMLTIESADGCASGATDTLVIRAMAGTYTGSSNDEIDASSSDPVILTSFDGRTRAVFAAAGIARSYNAVNYYPNLYVWGSAHVRNLDVMAGTNNGVGIMVYGNEDYGVIEGCRIYNNGATQNSTGIFLPYSANNNFHVANNIIHQPTTYGIWSRKDNWYNFVNNTLIGTGSGMGIFIDYTAFTANATITNNILYNWDYGIQTTSSTAATGVISNNLFYLVTNGRDLTNCTDAAKVSRDPLFHSVAIADPNAFKLLPGSPAIDAGTSTVGSGGFARTTLYDFFGSTRPQSGTPDIGAYEGSGFTPNPTADFDTLTNTVSGNTVIVKNSKWKLVWDMARGGGITGFYDMTGDSMVNLVASSNLLFDVRLDTHLASTKTANTIAPSLLERTRSRSVVRQRLALSASIDLNVTYSVYASGHIYVQSEIANLSAGTLDVDAVQYFLKLGAASAVVQSAGSLASLNYKNGYGYLTTTTKDAYLGVTRDLDEGALGASEVWSESGSIAHASLDSVGFSVADLTDIPRNMKRHHHLLLYVGDGSLDNGKASTLNADAYNPAIPMVSAGSLLHEKSWQDRLGGHWNLDEGTGSTARDRSINYTNDATLTSTTWVTGKSGRGLRFTTSSVGAVADNDALEVAQNRMYMLWVKPNFSTMGADAFILSKGLTTSDGWHFRRVNAASQIKFVVGSVSVTTPTLATDTWVHLAASIDGPRNVVLYVNGVMAAASTSAATPTVNGSQLRMGENAGSGAADRFAGDIDDVRIYHIMPPIGQLQSIVAQGFSAQYGHYHFRADNNNRVVATLNTTTAQTRVQPAFRIDNWWAPKTPKYVYMNGTRLIPNVDFVVDSIPNSSSTWDFGPSLVLQVNKVLTGADQTLFVDDNDSSGYLGATAEMKTLTMSATAGDKFVIKNFSDTVFGAATSGQWYLELDLDGWTSWNTVSTQETGFGEVNVWKAAATHPNVAVSAATNQVGKDDRSGRTLSHLKFDNTGNQVYSSGVGYLGPADITYTVVDSSEARISLLMTNMNMQGSDGTFTLSKRWTIYPTGRIVGSFQVTGSSFNFDDPNFEIQPRYNSSAVKPWAWGTADNNWRYGWMGGDVDFHSVVGAVNSLRSGNAITGDPFDSGTNYTAGSASGGLDYNVARLSFGTSQWTSANNPVTVNFALDISRDFTDSATADSLGSDIKSPAVITALGAGTANPLDALDFRRKNDASADSSDGFAEGDGAYVYTASGSGTAHFKFVNTVTHFSPAFRIKGWTFANLPEFVIVNNQTLTRGYQYNAYLSSANSEVILQFNKTFKPGTHLFYISHKTGLAVTLNRFEAKGGEGADTLLWTTESEFENLGFHVWRRVAADQEVPEALVKNGEVAAGAGIANALLGEARSQARAAAAKASGDVTTEDSLAMVSLTEAELKALGYVRITAKFIPGAKGGSSSSTSDYTYVDRGAAYGVTYEYLLEAVDFSGSRVQYGPRRARPLNPLETALGSNYPNPFNPITTLRFSLKERIKVGLVIYDARGRMVRTLITPKKAMAAGKYRLVWDAKDDSGFEVPSGQYFYRFTAGKYVKTRKMILVK